MEFDLLSFPPWISFMLRSIRQVWRPCRPAIPRVAMSRYHTALWLIQEGQQSLRGGFVWAVRLYNLRMRIYLSLASIL